METLVQGSDRSEASANGAPPPGASVNGHGGDGGGDPAAPARHCDACGAPMAADQDWCLECGTAAPGRLGGRPGWRAATTVVGLTLALVAGAVAASYAALSQDADNQAAQPAPPSATPVPSGPPDVASVPPASTPTTTPFTAPPVTPPAITTPTTSTPTGSTPAVPTIPTISTPSVPTVSTPVTSTPTTSTPATSTPTTSTPAKSTPTSSTPTTTTPAALTPISLQSDAASVYDPYHRATSAGDPAKALDGDTDTSWTVVTPTDGKDMQVGIVIDLGSEQHVHAVDLQTSTPGFRLEVYGADGSELPPDVLDTRWTHAASRSKVDENSKGINKPGDGKERVVLPKDGDKFHYILLWFTTPPNKATVSLSEIKLLS